MGRVEKVKLLTLKDDTYTTYVFQNLNNKEYIMCTKLPNWQTPEINIGDIGFLEYEDVKAGESYFDSKQGVIMKYLYTNTYFINFMRETNILQNGEIIL